jgi:hypothetical protein
MSQLVASPTPLRVRAASPLEQREVGWLWQGWLPEGKLALLDGDPGLGKSLLTLDLCASLSTGRPMPDGNPGPGAVPALVLNAEDGAEDTIKSRLEAFGADIKVTKSVTRCVAEPVYPLPAFQSQFDDRQLHRGSFKRETGCFSFRLRSAVSATPPHLPNRCRACLARPRLESHPLPPRNWDRHQGSC